MTNRFRLVLVMIMLLAAAGPAAAQTDPIKARKDNFQVLSDQMKAILKGLGDGAPISALNGRVGMAAAALGRVPELFPAGSDVGTTSALPAVWAEPVRFAGLLADAFLRMDELAAAGSGTDRDAFGAATGRMVAACGACHAVFRAE